MSVVAYDRVSISADRQATCGGMISIVPKIRESRGYVIAAVGYEESMMELFDWFEAGADPARYPETQSDEDLNSVLIVTARDGAGAFFRRPVLTRVNDAFFAWGSGREVAMGAMIMGADAETAVRVTCELRSDCGCGIDTFEIKKLKGRLDDIGKCKVRRRK